VTVKLVKAIYSAKTSFQSIGASTCLGMMLIFFRVPQYNAVHIWCRVQRLMLEIAGPIPTVSKEMALSLSCVRGWPHNNQKKYQNWPTRRKTVYLDLPDTRKEACLQCVERKYFRL
jgi:hypothetical protein